MGRSKRKKPSSSLTVADPVADSLDKVPSAPATPQSRLMEAFTELLFQVGVTGTDASSKKLVELLTVVHQAACLHAYSIGNPLITRGMSREEISEKTVAYHHALDKATALAEALDLSAADDPSLVAEVLRKAAPED